MPTDLGDMQTLRAEVGRTHHLLRFMILVMVPVQMVCL